MLKWAPDSVGELQMQPENEGDDEGLRERLKNLKEEMEAGRVKFASHLSVIDSLKDVRNGPDGKIDLTTVDSGVRALANAVSFAVNRRHAKEAVSLQDLQQSYFKFIERNFGEMYTEMNKHGADPSQVGAAISSDPDKVKEFMAGMPEFLSVIDDLWKDAWDTAYYHVQDITGLKAVFGGETFPSPRKNIVSCAGVYADTIVLPDPFLRTRFTNQQDDATAVRWFIKSALSLLHYREAALADVECPLAVIAPDASYVDQDEQEVMVRASEPSVLKHLSALFGTPFASLEEASEFLTPLAVPAEVTAKLADKRRLLFNEGDNGPLEQQIQEYMDGYFSPHFEGGAGTAILFVATGRMRQATDLLRRALSLGGAPLIDAPTSMEILHLEARL